MLVARQRLSHVWGESRIRVVSGTAEVMTKTDPSRKLEGERWTGPYTVSVVYDCGTLQLSKAAPAGGGAVSQVWNIRQVQPC